MPSNNGLTIRNTSETECEICLYDVVDQWGGISAKEFQRELKANGESAKTIHLRIKSPGGSVWEGLAMYSILRSHPAKKIVHIDGVAASIASIIAMAGDEIEMPSNAFMMIHNPADFCSGESEEMRKTAALLDQVKEQLVGIYVRRTGQTAEKISEMMDAETWMSGEDAMALKFCDRCTDALATSASCDPSRLAAYKHVPNVLNHVTLPVSQPEGAITMATEPTTPSKAATIKELRAACPGASEKFLCDQLEAEATVTAASAAWMNALADRNKALEDELQTAKAGKPGVAPTNPQAKKAPKKGGEEEEDEDIEDLVDLDDPIETFDSLVTKQVQKQVSLGQRADRMKAVAQVATKNPELHQAYLVACNGGGKRVKRLVDEKYDMMPPAK